MFPFVTISLFGSPTMVSTSIVLDIICLPLALIAFIAFFRKSISLWKQFAIVLGVALSAWIGARLFHVIWERPDYFKTHPWEILTNFQGMTFYGSFIAGFLAILFFNWVWVPQNLRAKMLDLASILVAFFYGVLRVGCFADGCCWGRLCRYPWAVRYFDPNSEMPYLGVPVHPVQLYDSFAGFLIAGALIYLYRNYSALHGRLIWIFFCLYAIARTITETFRGDAYRGVDLILGMSTSQLVSLFIFVAGVGALYLTSTKLSFKKSSLQRAIV